MNQVIRVSFKCLAAISIFAFAGQTVTCTAAETPKLVVVMGWLADFRVYEVESTPGDKAAVYLTDLKRGTKYKNPVTMADEYLSHNSLVTQTCAGDRVFYLWNGDGFRKVVPGK